MDRIIFAVVGIVVGLLIGFVIGMVYRKKVAEREIGSAELEATRLINEAIRSGESRKKEMLRSSCRGWFLSAPDGAPACSAQRGAL